jgi:outer membrane protein TolC
MKPAALFNRSLQVRLPCQSLCYSRWWTRLVLSSVLATLLTPAACYAKVTLADVVALALHNSPRILKSENDLAKAQAGLAVVKDIYIPSLVAAGGVGDAYGITLNIPTIFTFSAQSLVFSFQQRAYIRAARYDVQAASLGLAETRHQVEEDATIAYITLLHAEKVATIVSEQYEIACRSVSIVQDRVDGKLDSELDLKKTRRGALQIKLSLMQAQDDVESARSNLVLITKLTQGPLELSEESIPSMPASLLTADLHKAQSTEPPGMLAAEANLRARQERAHGDSQYAWRPQISFAAQYGRVSPINDVSEFYNLHGNYNTASGGLQISFPLLDKVRKAAAKESVLDVRSAALDLEGLRADQSLGHSRLGNTLPELAAKAELAEMDLSIADDELETTSLLLHGSAGGPPLSPKEKQAALMQKCQRQLDLLDARMQLFKAEISLLTQRGEFDDWLQS